MTALSIVTIAWRNERHAARFCSTLTAALARCPLPVELVVVVNGQDGEAAAAAICAHVPDIETRWVRLDVNTGYAGGANAGCDAAANDLVMIANLDLEFDTEFFAALGSAVPKRWSLLVPNVYRMSDRTTREGAAERRFHRHRWLRPQPDAATYVSAANGCCIVVRREALERRRALIGGLFESRYHSFNEDLELFWWASRAGELILFDPALRVFHAYGGSDEGRHRFWERAPEVQAQVMRNYRVTVWTHARGPRDWLSWIGGEAVYLGLAIRAGGPAGAWRWLTSWTASVRLTRAIRSDRGRLRVPAG